MLEVRNIETYYGPIKAIVGISLDVMDKDIVCILGANGAGKSTILKTIAGIMEPEKGTIDFKGIAINGLSPDRIVALGISFVPEGREVFPDLTVKESLDIGSFRRRNREEIIKDIGRCMEYFPILRERKSQPAGMLSGGEQQMLMVAMAFMARPSLLMVDEPSLGLAPLVTTELFRIFKQINESEKMGILLVEQNAKTALSISRYGYVLENGRLVLEGASNKLIEHPDIKEFYLGLKEEGVRGIRRWKKRKHW